MTHHATLALTNHGPRPSVADLDAASDALPSLRPGAIDPHGRTPRRAQPDE